MSIPEASPTPMVMQRREVKYRLTRAQKDELLDRMEGKMQPDSFGRSEIRSLYLDTPNKLLARRSQEKPPFKEKLRLRSYGPADRDTPVYLEIKRKYQALVYKRRICLPYGRAMECLNTPESIPEGQIARELRYTLELYGRPRPSAYIRCMREAFFDPTGSAFRVTFDQELCFRRECLTLTGENWGTPLLPEDAVLLELKIPDSCPLWMARALSEMELYPTSFSKYGAVCEAAPGYLPQFKGDCIYESAAKCV